ncbi:uncharacterized protein LOC143032187 [Oratosquilla oratoria]|uniref:uncharacterized protein LOC143032187 n=1 Tax=Oratosquilla oratoria TaxID=337810 RepID=UPI003F763626
MANRVGSIEPYNESEEDFDSYVSRIKMYFVANDVGDAKKVAAFFTLAGPKIFGLARDLLSPAKPEESTLDKVLDTLRAHFKPTPVLIYERYKFYSRAQKSNESVKDFVAALKALAHTCEFGTTLSQMLRDRFVMGLASDKIQQVLLTESELTFEKAVSMATARETASKDVQAMASGSVHYVPSKQQVTKKTSTSNPNSSIVSKSYPYSKTKFTNVSSARNMSNVPKTPCSGCGKLHWKRDCPFKNASCHLCKQKGHLKKMCYTSKSKTTPSKKNVSDEPIMMDVTLDSVCVPMEMDTGATCSLMPRCQYEGFWPVESERPPLNASLTVVNAYGGTPLKVLGDITVSAKLEDGSSVDATKLVVVEGKGPCLMGRVLMRRLGLLKEANKLSAGSAIATSMLHDFPELFSEGLGCYKERRFTIEVDQSVPPKFCKARTVPYTLRAKIDQEIDTP